MHFNIAMCFNCTGNQDLLGGLEYQLGKLQPQLGGVSVPFGAFPVLPSLLQLPTQVYSYSCMCLLCQL